MKDNYLEDLRRRLEEYDLTEDEMNDILSDYAEMIDDALGKSMSEEDIYNLIGTPRKVVQDLREQFKHDSRDFDDSDYDYGHKRDNRIVALMPFISVIIFFILGFGWGLWHPGWLVFLLIPMVAIIVNAFNGRFMGGLVALSPFIAVIVFLWLGFAYELWNPAWLVFLIIPVFGILAGARKMTFLSLLTALSPFLTLTAYVFIGYFTGVWHPTWLIFILIPIIGVLNERSILKMIIYEFSLIISAGAYLYIGYTTDVWGISLLVFAIPIGVSILFGDFQITFFDKDHKLEGIITLAAIAIYFITGYLFDGWAYMWMIFLAIPVVAILKNTHDRNTIVALMPFIATVIFFSLGFFGGWWQYAWMAYFLIPITAIIKNA